LFDYLRRLAQLKIKIFLTTNSGCLLEE